MHSKRANCRVVVARGGSVYVIKEERAITNGSVIRGGAIEDKRERSIGRIVIAHEVEQHRSSASGGIFIPGVDGPRSTAKAGVEEGGTAKIERLPTNCCVCKPGKRIGAIKSKAPFRCVEPAIAPVLVWAGVRYLRR